MIMGFAATLLERLAGKWLVPLVLPVLAVLALTLAKVAWDKRDARLIRQGEQICDARWMDEQRRAITQQLEDDIRTGRRIIEVERQIDEGLTNDFQIINESIGILRTPIAGGSDACLSPGVLDLLREGQGDAGAGSDAKGRKPAP